MTVKDLVFEERRYTGSITPTRTYDKSRHNNHGTWNTVTAFQIDSGLWVASLTGAATSYIDVGNIGESIQSACLWLFPDNIISQSFMDLDGGTHSLETDGSGDVTATGWATPTFYVNAIAATRLVVSTWNFVVVTTATAFTASDFDIGREAAAYFDGYVALCKLFGHALTVEEIVDILEEEKPLFGIGR